MLRGVVARATTPAAGTSDSRPQGSQTTDFHNTIQSRSCNTIQFHRIQGAVFLTIKSLIRSVQTQAMPSTNRLQPHQSRRIQGAVFLTRLTHSEPDSSASQTPNHP